MSNPPPSAEPSEAVKSTIRAYGERVEQFLEYCVTYQRHDPDVFLWNARRIAEASCKIVLLAVTGRVDPNPEAKLESLISEARAKGGLDDVEFTALKNIQGSSNHGVHVRTHDPEKYLKLVGFVKQPLADLVSWLYTRSAAHLWLTRPDNLDEQIARLVAGGRSERAPLDELRHQDAELTRLRAEAHRLSRERDALTGERDRLADLLQAARNTLKDSESLWIAERRGLEHRMQELAALPARSQRHSALLGLGGLGLGLGLASCVGLGLFGFADLGMSGGLAGASAEIAVHPPGAAPAAVVGEAPLRCPSGMVLIPAVTLQLGQPVGGRTKWPRASPESLDPIAVEAFCFDVDPLRWFEVPEPVAGGVRASRCAKAAGEVQPVGWAGCHSRAQAEEVCGKREPVARLPSIAEWEAVARAEAAVNIPKGRFWEWAQDEFPPHIFNRRGAAERDQGMFRQPLPTQSAALSPVGNVLYSWNQHDVDDGVNVLGFRCAFTAR